MTAVPAIAPETQSPPSSRRWRARTIVLIVLGAAALAWVAQLVYHYWRYEETDDAYVAGHVHQISPEANGQVVDVFAHENEVVRKGAVLARLDPLAFQIAVRRAEALAAQARAGVAQARAAARRAGSGILEARAKVSQAKAQAAQARAEATLAQLTLNRDRNMAAGNDRAVTPAELDSAKAAFDAAEAALDAAQAQEKVEEATVAAAQDERTAAEAEEQAAQADVQAADAAQADAARQASYVEIKAPASGIIGNKNVETGNRVQTGQELFALVEPEIWVEANFKETQLARMREGQPADVTVDAIPGRTFHGRVDSIAPASGAEFALLPADNSTGNFTKVVQRVPVRVSLPASEIAPYAGRLRPGLSVEVSVLVR